MANKYPPLQAQFPNGASDKTTLILEAGDTITITFSATTKTKIKIKTNFN